MLFSYRPSSVAHSRRPQSLFAYHIEALVPSSMQSAHMSQTPQKLSGAKDVHFFSVGSLGGRTLVIYMKRKGMDSVFRVLEPVVGQINERARQPASLGARLGFRPQRSDWFRTFRVMHFLSAFLSGPR
jgi:hypothetical protein